MLPYIFLSLIIGLSVLLASAIHHEFHNMTEHPERYRHHFKH